MALRQETIVTVLAVLVIAIAIPFAIMDTIETGRVTVLKAVLRGFTSAVHWARTLPLHPATALAILLGIRGGLADAKAGNPPTFLGRSSLLDVAENCCEAEWRPSGTWSPCGIILDIVFQLVIYRSVHPGAALLIGPILICLPYALSRALTTRLARRMGEKHGINESPRSSLEQHSSRSYRKLASFAQDDRSST